MGKYPNVNSLFILSGFLSVPKVLEDSKVLWKTTKVQLMKYRKSPNCIMQERALLYRPCIWNFPFCTLPHPLPPPKKKSTTNFKISFYRPSPLFPNKTRAIYFCYDNVAKRKKVFFDTVEEITATRKILSRKLSCVEENSNKNVSLKIILVERPKKLICLILCFDYLR